MRTITLHTALLLAAVIVVSACDKNESAGTQSNAPGRTGSMSTRAGPTSRTRVPML